MIPVLSFLLFSFLVPVILLSNSEINTNLLLAAGIVFYSGLQLVLLIIKKKSNIMQLTFWVFVYVWLGVAVMMQLGHKRFPWGGFYEDHDITLALLAIIIGFFTYQIGISLGEKRDFNKKIFERPMLSIKHLTLFSIIIFIFSLFVIVSFQGIDALFSPRVDANNNFDDKMQALLVTNLSRVPIFGCLMLALMQRYKPWKLIIFLIIANLLISNPISTPRYWFGSMLLSILFLIIPWSLKSMAKWVYSLLIILLLIFPFADLFRYSFEVDIKYTDAEQIMTQKGDYDAFQMIMNARKYTELYGYSQGKQMIGNVLFFAPRSMWPKKPYGTGRTIADGLGYKFGNLSCPLWAELYFNFSWIGIIVGFLCYGYLSRRLEKAFLYYKGVTFFSTIVPFLAAYQIFFLRGDLLNGVAYSSLFLGFMFVSVNIRFKKKEMLKLAH